MVRSYVLCAAGSRWFSLLGWLPTSSARPVSLSASLSGGPYAPLENWPLVVVPFIAVALSTFDGDTSALTMKHSRDPALIAASIWPTVGADPVRLCTRIPTLLRASTQRCAPWSHRR